MTPFDPLNLGKKYTLLLAHGAGAGANSDFMQALRLAFEPSDIDLVRFEFGYMQQMTETGKRRPPSPFNQLIEQFSSVIAWCQEQTSRPLWIGGKSMGGRVASHLLGTSTVMGGIVYGYPFHPPGKPDKLRTEHLQQITKPLHIIQGERDTFGSAAEVSELTLDPGIELHWIPDGDHSFKPRKRSGYTLPSNLAMAASITQQIILDSE
ncbi:MAG: dienelactone hydrolase family protein [Gammaproteobacteria bacterium]|nr:dienelactone hydrolase family protein [Gammaproteobacteria bacterium]NVK87073.1 dienelactone hydrolase family protein [Gammaproteobacteria bacterium]